MNVENQQETIGQPFSWTELAKVGQEARNTHRLLAKTRPPQEGACPADEECGEQQGGFSNRSLFNADGFQAVKVDGSKVVLALFSNRCVCINILTMHAFLFASLKWRACGQFLMEGNSPL